MVITIIVLFLLSGFFNVGSNVNDAYFERRMAESTARLRAKGEMK